MAEFHPDISRLQLYTAADDYKILVWNLQTSTCIASLDSHYSVVTALQFDSTGNTLYRSAELDSSLRSESKLDQFDYNRLCFTCSGGRDNVVHVWDIQGFVKKKTLPVYEVSYASDTVSV